DQHLTAKHRALVVDQVQNHWPLTEIITQTNRLAAFIAEYKTGRNLLIQPLLDSDILESRWAHIRRWRHDPPGHSLTPDRDRQEQSRGQNQAIRVFRLCCGSHRF